jgi:hypothetical protein
MAIGVKFEKPRFGAIENNNERVQDVHGACFLLKRTPAWKRTLPQGYGSGALCQPLIADLKRKSFVATRMSSERAAHSAEFVDEAGRASGLSHL